MASSFNQDPIQSSRLVNRRYFQIPKDQNELLEREDAWSDSLSSGPHGMLNVPDHVLQDVKTFHLRKHANLSTQDSSTAQDGKTSNTEAMATVTNKPRESASSPPPENNNDRDDDGTPVSSWSASGADEDENPAQESVEAPVEERVKAVDAVSVPLVRHGSRSPGTSRHNDSSLQFPAAVPSSSIANSDDLEIEAPGYLSQEIDYPVNRGALRAIASTRPEPTPPSAQIPVATVASAIQPITANKQRMIGHIPENVYEHVHKNAAVLAPYPSKWEPAPPDAHQRSSTTAASSSILPSGPQSLSEKTSESRLPRVIAGPVEGKAKSSNFTPTWEGRRQTSPSPHFTKTGLLEPAFAAEYPMFDNRQKSQRTQRASSKFTPYDDFQAAYPDYPETARKFVSGCLNVKQVMRDRTLPEFLYDDFVRAFSTDYMLYISECNRKKAKKILPAVEWYNETTEDPQYMKRVIRKDNLATVLEAHADDVHAIRRSLGDSQSTSSESVVSDSDEEMLDASVEYDQEDEDIEDSGLEDAQKSELSHELHIESPGIIANPEATKHGRDESGAEREEAPGAMDAAMVSVMPTEDGPMEERERPTEVSPKQAAKPRSSPSSRFRSPSSKIADVRSRTGASKPKAHNTPPKQKSPSHSHHSVTSSDGSIATISPRQYLRPRPSSLWEGQKIAGGTERHNGERGQRAPVTSLSKSDNAKKRPLSADEADDEEEEDAFDPPVKEPMPPPPKRPARPSPGSLINPVSTPVFRKSFPSTMPIAARPTFTPSGLGTTGTGQASSHPTSASGMAAERGRSVSLSERSYTNTCRSKKRMSEVPAERAKSFREFLKKRRSAGTPSATPVRQQ